LSLGCLSMTGRFPEYSTHLARALEEAQLNGDLYSRFALPLSTSSYLLCLASDKPEESHRELDDKLAAWSRSEFDFPHYRQWFGKVETYLYQNRCEEAWRLVGDTWKQLGRSLLLPLQFQGLLARQIRARSAIALYANGDHQKRWLREASSFVKYCAQSQIEVARGFSALMEASLEMCRGNPTSAGGLLGSAEGTFRRLGWSTYAMAACFRRGALTGGDDGRSLQELAAHDAAAIGVGNVAAFAQMLIPGPFPTSRR
jgi:hypothetical protein